MAPVSLISIAIFAIVFLLPLLSVVGAWIWAQRIGRRTDVPRFVKWVAYALAIPGALFVALGVTSGLIHSFSAVSGENVEPSQKARVLAEGISEFMNGTAVGLLFTVAALLWLGFWAWRWRPRTPPEP